MSSLPSSLTAEGLWWRYRRGPWVLRDLSVTVAPGELLRVRGGNGHGKSTLLRLLAGVHLPARGRVAGPAGSPICRSSPATCRPSRPGR